MSDPRGPVLTNMSPVEIGARILRDRAAGRTEPGTYWDTPAPPSSVAQMESARADVAGRSIVYDERLGWWEWSRGRGRWVPFEERELLIQAMRYDGMRYGEPKEPKGPFGKPSWATIQMTGRRRDDAVTSAQLMATVPDFFERAPASYALGSRWTAVVAPGQDFWAPPAPDIRCRVGLDYDGPDEIAGTELMEAVWRVLDHPEAEEEERDVHRQQFLEWLGLSLLGIATQYQRGIMLIGTHAGGNGKGWLMDTIASLLPPETVKQMTGTLDLRMDFDRAQLVGRRLMIAREQDAIGTVKVFNGLVAADRMVARFLSRGSRDGFDFTPTAGVIMDFNLPMPKIGAEGLGGVERRWCPLWALNTLTGQMTRADLQRLAREQGAGLALLALQAAEQVIDRGGITPLTPMQQECIRTWLKTADPVALFLDEFVVTDPDGYMLSADAHQRYVKWAEHHRFEKIQSIVGFGRSLSKWLPKLGGRHSTHLEGGRGWKGVTLIQPTRTVRTDEGRIDRGFRTDDIFRST